MNGDEFAGGEILYTDDTVRPLGGSCVLSLYISVCGECACLSVCGVYACRFV